MTPIGYKVKVPPGAHWGRFRAYCPSERHVEAVLIARWSTFDGVNVLQWFADGEDEYVGGWVPTPDGIDKIQESPVGRAVQLPAAKARGGDTDHWLHHIRCPVEICAYHYQVRSDTLEPVKKYVRALWAAKLPSKDEHNLEAWLNDPRKK
jgi:hypothetical protein